MANKANTTEIPDLNRRDNHRQTIPTEEDFDSPPPYESSTAASTSYATPPTASSTAPTQRTPPSPTPSTNSSVDGRETSNLMGAAGGQHQEGYKRGPQFEFHMGYNNNGNNLNNDNSQGYKSNAPMTSDSNESKWEAMKDTPGCCCSDSGGCCGSSRGGCCFSDRGGCCFSDTTGCCFSESGGCCFSTNGACCCSNGPERRPT
jgi:hypothetical protein